MVKKHFKLTSAVYAIFTQREDILLLRRSNTGYEDGKYSLVAGHLDGGEFPTDAMIREAREEAGVTLHTEDLRCVHVMHRLIEGDERMDLFFEVIQWEGTVQNAEPHKCSDLRWFPINDLPSNTIPYICSAIAHYKNKIFFSEFAERTHKKYPTAMVDR